MSKEKNTDNNNKAIIEAIELMVSKGVDLSTMLEKGGYSSSSLRG